MATLDEVDLPCRGRRVTGQTVLADVCKNCGLTLIAGNKPKDCPYRMLNFDTNAVREAQTKFKIPAELVQSIIQAYLIEHYPLFNFDKAAILRSNIFDIELYFGGL